MVGGLILLGWWCDCPRRSRIARCAAIPKNKAFVPKRVKALERCWSAESQGLSQFASAERCTYGAEEI